MEINDLMKLQKSSEAPFNHQEYTVWLHNKIIDSVRTSIQQYGGFDSIAVSSTCENILSLPSLKPIQ